MLPIFLCRSFRPSPKVSAGVRSTIEPCDRSFALRCLSGLPPDGPHSDVAPADWVGAELGDAGPIVPSSPGWSEIGRFSSSLRLKVFVSVNERVLVVATWSISGRLSESKHPEVWILNSGSSTSLNFE